MAKERWSWFGFLLFGFITFMVLATLNNIIIDPMSMGPAPLYVYIGALIAGGIGGLIVKSGGKCKL